MLSIIDRPSMLIEFEI